MESISPGRSHCDEQHPLQRSMRATLSLLQTANIPSLQWGTKDNMGKMLIVCPSNPSKATCSLVSHPVSIFTQHACLFLAEKYIFHISWSTERVSVQKCTYVNKNSNSLNAFSPINLHLRKPNSLIKPLICLPLRPAPYTKECPYWGGLPFCRACQFSPSVPSSNFLPDQTWRAPCIYK